MSSRSLHTSLHCLIHPATLLCIGLLVLNDHLFKAVAPSWSTGKLSDLAGLFFFPFLLAAALGILFEPLCRRSAMAVGRIAFVLAVRGLPWPRPLPGSMGDASNLPSVHSVSHSRV